MKRRYKLFVIILLSGILTYLIYFFNRDTSINLVAIGDGIASGETSYNIDGISYNDYLKEYFENKNLLKNYNSDYTYENYKVNELLNDLETNETSKEDNKNINQILHNADIITIGIGEEELTKLAITEDLKFENVKEILRKYDVILNSIRKITDAKIILVGFYENNYLDTANIIILNSELSNLSLKYEANFIDISDLLLNKDYFLSNEGYYFNYKAHKIIAEMIINTL